ncbi:MAG TPA: AsmA family protein [Acetobacteraceae bacterium]|nr:AsmA family protein [Acetobacteraceae bacterium]
MARPRAWRWLACLGILALAIIALVLLWNWDWFIPLVDARAAAATGRPVTIGHLHVRLGRVTQVTADDVTLGNPPGFPSGPPLARLAHLTIRLDVMAYLHGRHIVIPLLALDHPVIDARATPGGANNYTFASGSSGHAQAGTGTNPSIGDLRISQGTGDVVIPKLRADFDLTIATAEPASGATPAAASAATPTLPAGPESELLVDAKGTYAGQPVTGHFVGGALLSLRDAAHPYPVDLRLQNGATRVSLTGTVRNPLAFAGTDLKLSLAGADMAQLYPLTGIPIPQTPAYRISGRLDYDRASQHIRFTDFAGVVGNSDLEGTIAVDPGRARPDVTADLHSRRVDLADLGGFIGSQPGRRNERNATPAERRAVARAEANPRLLPTTPINLPKLKSADMHIRYRGARIEGRSVPLDNLAVVADIVDGAIRLHPLSFGIGRGAITGNIDLTPVDKLIHAKADIDFRRVDLSRIMAATHAFQGAGTIGGSAAIDTRGNSLASMLGNGNGNARIYLVGGGDLSALLVDLSGFEFGNALFSALGVPRKTQIQCFIGDWLLRDGVLETRALVLDTGEAIVDGSGTVDLKDERLDYRIRTRAKHFTIGSLPAPIGITGTFKHPSIRPDLASLGARGGIAAGLGFLAAPLALLPTIQLGVGDDHRCDALLHGTAAPRKGG